MKTAALITRVELLERSHATQRGLHRHRDRQSRLRENEKGERVWFDYPPAQQDAIVALVKDIVQRHQILPERVLGHSDIAPQRKQDPGPRFPWKRLLPMRV